MAIGIALSYKKKKTDGNIYVLVGDGECYEGSIWEAAISAVEFDLDNLTVFVDCNGFQNDGAVGKAMTYDAIKENGRALAGIVWNATDMILRISLPA